jgi:hypothetical protein
MSGVSGLDIEDILAASTFSVSKVGNKTCVVVCTLPSGFEITETSACVDPNDFSLDIGADICKLKIKDKLWELEGYRKQASECARHVTFKERVVIEKRELDEKLAKLKEFMGTTVYASLIDVERGRLNVQRNAMERYSDILGARISAF